MENVEIELSAALSICSIGGKLQSRGQIFCIDHRRLRGLGCAHRTIWRLPESGGSFWSCTAPKSQSGPPGCRGTDRPIESVAHELSSLATSLLLTFWHPFPTAFIVPAGVFRAGNQTVVRAGASSKTGGHEHG